jgi:hypothetical protein
MLTACHITHEAAGKVGGIGAVINGLITTAAYGRRFGNTLLYAPLFNRDGGRNDRLGSDSEVLYSGLDGYDADCWRERFAPVEERFGIRIIYGKRRLYREFDSSAPVTVDLVLADVFEMHAPPLAELTFRLWESFGIQSDRYQDWDYEQYLRIAVPYHALLAALYGTDTPVMHFAHEYMGIPCCLATVLAQRDGLRPRDRTIFYAHEVTTARSIVEQHQGHDISFYNIMAHDTAAGIRLEERFGSQAANYRSELVKAAASCAAIFAVSDRVAAEYRYLVPAVDTERLRVVYNGIPIHRLDAAGRAASRRRLQEYGEILFNFRPDFVFTHVTRLIISKGIWRDIKLLHHLDAHFAARGIKGIYILLASLIVTGRPAADVARMEREYGWPVLHRRGWPDLMGFEEGIYDALTVFNATSRAIKGVFLNQFGFSRAVCGERMPAEMQLFDLRAGSDVELGFSIYEPFGIAQLETFPYGGLPLLSRTCGSADLLEQVIPPGEELALAVDFTRIPPGADGRWASPEALLAMNREDRNHIEDEITRKQAPEIFNCLMRRRELDDRLLELHQERAPALGWESIVSERILPWFAAIK